MAPRPPPAFGAPRETRGAPRCADPTPGRRGDDPARPDIRSSTCRGSQQPLHHDDVHPAAVQQALLAVDTDAREAEPRIERHAGGIVGKRGEHHLVIAERARALDEPREHDAADAAAAPGALDVDTQVDDVVVRRPRVEPVETAPGDGGAVDLAHQYRMA